MPKSRGSRPRIAFWALAVLIAACGWVTWREVWGRPLWINHFYERVFIEAMFESPQLLSQIGLAFRSSASSYAISFA
jgi:hypothetical protein